MNAHEAIELIDGWTGSGSTRELREAVETLEKSQKGKYGSANVRMMKDASERGRSLLRSLGVSGFGMEVGPRDPAYRRTDGRPDRTVVERPGDSARGGQTQASSGGSSQFGDIESTILQGLDGGTGQLAPIGGFFKEPADTGDRFPGIPGPIRDIQQSNTLQDPYYEGDEFTLLRDMPEEQLVRLQDTLVALGLAPDVVPGELDDGTLRGFSRLLAMSNRNGERWSTTVSRLERSIESGEFGDPDEPEPPGFVEPARLEADPARVREEIRQFGEKRLGRDLNDDEIDHLSSALIDLERSDFDNMVAEERGIHEATQEAQLTGEDQRVGDFAEHGAGVVSSQFSELFRERYGKELQRRDDVEMGQVVQNLISGGTRSVGQMTGGF